MCKLFGIYCFFAGSQPGRDSPPAPGRWESSGVDATGHYDVTTQLLQRFRVIGQAITPHAEVRDSRGITRTCATSGVSLSARSNFVGIGCLTGSVICNEPAVPTVDLPRVPAAQFCFYDHTVGAFLVTDDEDMARWIDAFASSPPATVAADIETRGLDTDKYVVTAVTVAFRLGGDTVAVLFDPLRRDQHRKLLAKVFDHASLIVFHGATFDIAPLYAHRLMTTEHIRKVGDTLVAARMIDTNNKAGRSLEDLSTAYKVMTDDRTTIDAVFEARGVTKRNGFWFTDIDCPTYVVGALSDTVATLRLWGTPGVHGEGIVAAAARYLTDPELKMDGSGVLSAADAERVVEEVQEVNRIILARTARGYRVDAEFPARFLAETGAETEAAARLLSAHGVRPGNGRDMVHALVAAGDIDANLWPKSPTGQLKADKKSLEIFDNMADDAASPLVKAHQQVARSEKVLGYVTKVVELAGPTGRLHPEIKVLGASATGRMCLPESERLLTRRGIVAVDDIRVGDRTIDADGKWTTVRAVHRYSDAHVRTYRLTNDMFITCTPEHRWAVMDESGVVGLKTLDAMGPGDRVCLTPGVKFDEAALQVEFVRSPAAMDAYARGTALRTDALLVEKAAKDLQFALGLTGKPRSAEHALAMRTTAEALREARTAATAVKLRESGTVTDHPLLWALEAPLLELWAALAGAGLIGSDRCGLSSFDDHWRSAFEVAFYRIGHHEWRPTTPLLYERIPADASEHRDVWCVTTDSGTFTAWGLDGPYLTGNSASNPEIQQFPDIARGVILADDEDWISADWKSIEPVVLATASGDSQFIEQMRAGADPYEPVGQLAGVDRKLAKRKMLADMYGQGHKAAALQFGWTLDRAKEVAFKIRDGLPILYRLIDALKAQSEATGNVTTLTGRVVDQRFSYYDNGVRYTEFAERVAPNHFCQGSALDVMHYAILELDRRGLSDHVHLWMHDEVVADVSIAEELIEVMSTPPPFLEAVAAFHKMQAFLAVDLNEVGQRWKSV